MSHSLTAPDNRHTPGTSSHLDAVTSTLNSSQKKKKRKHHADKAVDLPSTSVKSSSILTEDQPHSHKRKKKSHHVSISAEAGASDLTNESTVDSSSAKPSRVDETKDEHRARKKKRKEEKLAKLALATGSSSPKSDLAQTEPKSVEDSVKKKKKKKQRHEDEPTISSLTAEAASLALNQNPDARPQTSSSSPALGDDEPGDQANSRSPGASAPPVHARAHVLSQSSPTKLDSHTEPTEAPKEKKRSRPDDESGLEALTPTVTEASNAQAFKADMPPGNGDDTPMSETVGQPESGETTQPKKKKKRKHIVAEDSSELLHDLSAPSTQPNSDSNSQPPKKKYKKPKESTDQPVEALQQSPSASEPSKRRKSAEDSHDVISGSSPTSNPDNEPSKSTSDGDPRPRKKSKVAKPTASLTRAPSKDATRRDSSTGPPVKPSKEAGDSIRYSKWATAQQLIEQGIEIKQGKFSKPEEELVAGAMKSYGREHKITQETLVELICSKNTPRTKTSEINSYITQRVPQRTMAAVYNYVKRKYNPMSSQGAWKLDDDERLTSAYATHGPRWEAISLEVGRTAGDCRDRYRNYLQVQDTKKSGSWTEDEDDKLTEIVRSLADTKGPGESGQTIFWTAVAEHMGGTRSRQQCRIRWQDTLEKREKVGEQVHRWGRRETYRLVHDVAKMKGIKHSSEIDWRALKNAEWSFWSEHEIQRKWRVLERGVADHENMPFSEIVHTLVEKHHTLPEVKVAKIEPDFKSAEMISDDGSDSENNSKDSSEEDS